MEITKREVLASITIIAVMMIFGIIIAGRIDDYQVQKNSEYYSALQITDAEQFQYGMDTSVGNAFVYGTLEAADPVTYPELGGAYLYVEKVEEHYNMHTRTVTETDSKGNTHTRTEVYWSWDYFDSESIHSEKIRFLTVEFDYGKIKRPTAKYITRINESPFVRFDYNAVPGEVYGTIYTDLRDGTISDNTEILVDTDIENAVKQKTITWIPVFWMVWIVFTGAVIYGFCYLGNDWLNIDE